MSTDTATPHPAEVSVPKSTNDEPDRIRSVFEAQVANLQALKDTSLKARKKKLKALRSTIFTWRERIQEAVHADFQRAHTETDVIEIYPAVADIKHVMQHMWEWAAPEDVDTPLTYLGSSSYVLKEPKGASLVITPWNYPFFLSISPIAYAVAAGCSVVLKPSEFTPNTSLLLKEMLAEVFSEDEVAVVLGDHTVSKQLLDLKFNHIHFTGSPGVGKIVMRAASKHLTSVTLELGGKSPTIVDKTANVRRAAKKIAWGKWINAGQTCVAPDYVLVHSSKKEALQTAVREELETMYGADPARWSESNDFCRMVNAKHYGRVKDVLRDAVEKGATVAFGDDHDDAARYLAPTLLTDVPAEAEVMEEEIFGPVLPVIAFDDLDEALRIINAREKPLALYIFSRKQKNIDRILQNTSAGGTCINETVLHVSQVNLPFGGINNSGFGKSHGRWGFLDFCNERAVLRQHLPFSAAQMLYPPYTPFVRRMITWTMKWF